ncbi:hypothetical protein ACJIZ3_004042 [Penstemon smallii]|uniref:Uncharacterized protein n=1 Tax=Penstemon smallii TaxID=265156 RepID=A0ABD3S110_9LAMI
MAFPFSFTLKLFLLLATLQASTTNSQEIKSARLLDLLIRDYTFKSYTKNFKTGKLHKIHLPSNLSGINVDSIRFRCGSLYRYGAKINEFHLGIGLDIQPCIKRVVLVRQNLGSNWSSIYYNNYELSGYELISPVLGLLAYNANRKNFTSIQIKTGKKPITIDFSNTTLMKTTSGIIPLCASFDVDGRVSLSNLVGKNVYVCVANKNGHFGLVVESPLMPLRKKMSKWKIAIGSAIGGVLGIVLLSLLAIAMFVKAKKKAKMDELERRAYEEEALQVSMVGHVRAFSASGTRTVPTTIEQDDVAIAAFAAMEKVVFVSCSADNGGPNSSTLASDFPWVITVGASTIDRSVRAIALLGNGDEFDGESLYQPKDLKPILGPLIDPSANVNQIIAYCGPRSLTVLM